MYSKIEITGIIEVVTGMHIGGSDAFSAIGAIDSPIIKDVRTKIPIIPGSSLKGKIRTLIARQYNEVVVNHDKDDEKIQRLFGSSKKIVKRSRLIFSDMQMVNAQEFRNQGLTSLTEVKFENKIDRCTGVATPRQIERAMRGSKFELSIIYEVENIDEMEQDIEMLCMGMKLLQYDYLGGNGSRGYGKIKFNEMEMDVVVGEVDNDLVEKCRLKLKEV